MEPKVIAGEIEYQKSMSEINRLMGLEPAPGSRDAEKLELFALLVEKYEKENFNINSPDPVDLILFCMEDRGLKQIDLIPSIGSKGKVSEVLSGKRDLTLPMIKALSKNLSIPIELLIKKDSSKEDFGDDFSKFPISMMKKLKWISGSSEIELKKSVSKLFEGVGNSLSSPVMFRKTFAGKGANQSDVYALYAWTAQILKMADEKRGIPTYNRDLLNEKFFSGLASLSLANDGPKLAQERLLQYGIILVIEQHLPKTRLDGASFLTGDGHPVVGMTLRYDRLDNFWFTLMHELAHVYLHLNSKKSFFFDDIDSKAGDELEREADSYATNFLISDRDWENSMVKRMPSAYSIIEYSKKWNVHPAIIAGRIRFENDDPKIFSHLIGQGQVRKQFDFVSVK